jgi:NAD(P)-dependent dehydrogenase (short-subunit alcohol dehydrogenase family)
MGKMDSNKGVKSMTGATAPKGADMADSTGERRGKIVGGVAMGTQEAIKALRARGGGAIVNTASVAALQAMPTDPVYSATKAGVVRIVESCAGFASEGIRVNAVLPGMVDTDMTMKQTGDGTRPAAWLAPVLASTVMLTPEDIAVAVIALIEDDTAAGQAKIVGNVGRDYK